MGLETKNDWSAEAEGNYCSALFTYCNPGFAPQHKGNERSPEATRF
jgi:hypothetical protein